jgi:hypothetical protein
MPRFRSARHSRALIALVLAAGVGLSEATYYGRYNRYGGTTVVRTTTVVRRPRVGWGRRLLQDIAEPPLASELEAPAPAPRLDDDAEDCSTVLDVVRSRPELSLLKETLDNLPRVRAALDDPTRTDTFFAPTNAAIEGLLAWGGFVEKAKVRRAKRFESSESRRRNSETSSVSKKIDSSESPRWTTDLERLLFLKKNFYKSF